MTPLVKQGPDFYDEPGVFEIYTAHRARSESPNETMEQPILWELIGDPGGFNVLDLGCGDARVAKKFRHQGAKSYLGVDGSQKMLELARLNIEEGFSSVQHSWLEDFEPSAQTFDLVVSSLALHYVADMGSLMTKIFRSLKSGGRFIFSVEHPVITSSNKALESSTLRQAWIVDNYFERGPRPVNWMGDTVTKYHRTVEDFLNELLNAGFVLEKFREADPPRQFFTDDSLWLRRRRIPLFLVLGARKV